MARCNRFLAVLLLWLAVATASGATIAHLNGSSLSAWNGVTLSAWSGSSGVVSSGASTPLTITSSTCIHWYDSDDITQLFQDAALTTAVAANNDPLGGWKDKGTLAQHFLLNGANTLRPLYKTSIGLDSKPGIQFDGVDDQLEKTLSTMAAHTVFIVFRSDTGAPSYGTLLLGNTDIYGAQIHTTPGTSYVLDIYSSGDHSSSATALDSYALFTFDYNGSGTMNAWKGAVSPVQFMTAVTGIYGSSSAKQYDRIGAHGSEPLKGAILQIIIYNTVLGSTDRAAVIAWILGKYPSLSFMDWDHEENVIKFGFDDQLEMAA